MDSLIKLPHLIRALEHDQPSTSRSGTEVGHIRSKVPDAVDCIGTPQRLWEVGGLKAKSNRADGLENLLYLTDCEVSH